MTSPVRPKQPADKEVHYLTFRIMRIYKPLLAQELNLSHEEADWAAEALKSPFNSDNEDSTTTNFGLSQAATFPITGDIYFGESFSCYVSVFNHTDQPLQQVTTKIELQARSQRVTLLEEELSEALAPGQSIDHIVQHAVTELDTHIMMVTINYQRQNEKKTLRKYFKFQVLPSLTLESRIVPVHSGFAIESSVCNMMKVPMQVEQVEFVAEEAYHATNLQNTSAHNNLDLPPSLAELIGDIVSISSGDVHKFLFKVLYKNPLDPNIPNYTSLGRVKLSWRTHFGGQGVFLSEPFVINLQQDRTLSVVFTQIPEQIYLERPFTVTLELVNRGTKPIVPSLTVLKHKVQGLMIMGQYELVTNRLLPKSSASLQLTLFPLKPGVQKLPLLRVVDTLTDKIYDFNNILTVTVLQNNVASDQHLQSSTAL
jgi:hypothetical protein